MFLGGKLVVIIIHYFSTKSDERFHAWLMVPALLSWHNRYKRLTGLDVTSSICSFYYLIVLNRKTKYFGRLDVLILYPSTLLGASLTGILRTAFLCTGMDSVGKYFPGTSC